MSDDTRFDELSRKAAAGTLAIAEREWLEHYLSEHAERRADLDWDSAFADVLHEEVARMPARPGWERTLHALEPDRLPAAGVLDRLARWLTESFGMKLNLQAAAAVLVVAQAGLIAVLAWPPANRTDDLVRAPDPRAARPEPLLRVSFRAELRESDLRRALADIGGEIVGGPGQIGIYLVRVKDGDLGVAADRLRASGVTELVEVLRP